MEIGETLSVKDRARWRAWLEKNHSTATEIWLITYKKHTGRPTLPYDDAVEEALCFGWIDSIVKRLDDDRTAQRYSPCRPRSNLSETNRERARRLIASGGMTDAGLAAIGERLNARATIAPDILEALKRDPAVWRNFRRFPASYRRIRIGWIESARARPEVFETRLRYLIRMTAKNRTYGTVR